MVTGPRAPDAGDIVWLSFSPQAGHEQAGNRPALVLSPRDYNRKSGLAVFCPITSNRKGYPFEVVLPPAAEVAGVVLADQVKSLDWRARRVRFICKAPPTVVREVQDKLSLLLGRD